MYIYISKQLFALFALDGCEMWCKLQMPMENTFLDLVTFLLDLDTFTAPYYNSFGDGYPSFGPARPPAGPHPSLLLDLALSQTIPLLDRFSSFCPAASA